MSNRTDTNITCLNPPFDEIRNEIPTDSARGIVSWTPYMQQAAPSCCKGGNFTVLSPECAIWCELSDTVVDDAEAIDDDEDVDNPLIKAWDRCLRAARTNVSRTSYAIDALEAGESAAAGGRTPGLASVLILGLMMSVLVIS